MKILSDTAITKSDLTAIDVKQDKKIKILSICLALSFLGNTALTLVLKYLV